MFLVIVLEVFLDSNIIYLLFQLVFWVAINETYNRQLELLKNFYILENYL